MSAAAKINPQPTIKLVIQKGPHAGQRFSFSKTKVTIGCSPENDIILVNDPLISRQHAYIQLNENDVEIINQSSKNPILVNNESVNKWKLTSDTIFMIGDTEFLVQIENLQSVVVMKPPQSPVATAAPAKNSLKLVPKNQIMQSAMPTAPKREPPKVYSQPPPQFQVSSAPTGRNPKLMFYLILGAVVAVAIYFYLGDSSQATQKRKSTLKYSDETAMKMTAQESSESFKKQENAVRIKKSSAYMRAEESFSKGMRAFQLGNYNSAREFFQMTLATNSEHVLAKRYLYLSKVRFDEVVKAKLDLGQSYFDRNNFKLCKAMFQQVIDMLGNKEMLQGQSKDTNLQLAKTMLKKCEFAAEGIH